MTEDELLNVILLTPVRGFFPRQETFVFEEILLRFARTVVFWSKMQACLVTLQEIPKPEEKLARLWALTAIMIQDLTTTSMSS